MTDFSKYGTPVETSEVKETKPVSGKVDFSKYGSETDVTSTKVNETKEANMGIIDRLKLSFGTKEQRAQLQEPKGFGKGGLREMIGDAADMVGGSFPVIGGIIGSAGGAIGGMGVGAIPGAAIGAGAGESVRRTIGQLLGVRDDATPLQEATGPLGEGLITLVGGKVIQKGGSYIASRFPTIFGLLTGKDDDIVRAAFQNPKAADEGLKNGDGAIRAIVERGKEKSIQIRDSFNQAFNTAFNKISGVYKDRPIDKTSAFDKFNELLKDAKVTFSPNGVIDYSLSKINANPGEITQINKAVEMVNKWDDWTLKGVIDLKRNIGAFTKFANEGGGTSKSPLLGQFYHHLDEQIRSTLPKTSRKAYDALNANYSKYIDTFDDLVDAFNRGDAFTRIANMFSKNRDELRELIKVYEEKTGISVTGTVAGRELNERLNRSMTGIWNPALWADILLPSGILGKIITGAGHVNKKVVKPAVDKAVDVVQYTGKTLDEFLTR